MEDRLLEPVNFQLNGSLFNSAIKQYKLSILYALEHNQVVIVKAPTGSGKSTQLPLFLLEAGWADDGRVIGVTQPRRLAASSLAEFVSSELNTKLGEEVGYSMRFQDLTSSKTRLKYLTDGMLLREIYRDPLLSKYSVIMIDEAHERSNQTDLLLAVIKKILKQRSDLRVIVASATVDDGLFEDFFKMENKSTKKARFDVGPNELNTKLRVTSLCLEGKSYPVDLLYLRKPCENFLDQCVETVMEIHQKELPGDILVFLTGKEDIDHIASELYGLDARLKGHNKLHILCLHSNISHEDQQLIFNDAPPNERKVILATNIAETSLTIPNIRYVVDPGFVKLMTYDANTQCEALKIVSISQANAQQRAGRSGRTAPGKVYRLYTEETYLSMPTHTVPEIQRTDPTPILLFLKAIGVANLVKFSFVSPPPTDLVSMALEKLFRLGIIDLKGNLVEPLGTQLAELPIHPSLGKLLFESIKYKCSSEALIVAAMLSIKSVVYPGSKAESVLKPFAVEEGDLISFINVFNSYSTSPKTTGWCKRRSLSYTTLNQAENVLQQLTGYFKRLFNIPIVSCNSDTIGIRKCILMAYPKNVVRLNNDGSVRTLFGDNTFFIHPDSVLFRRNFEYAVYTDVQVTTRAFVRNLTVIDPEWLLELLPDDFKTQRKGPSDDVIPMLG